MSWITEDNKTYWLPDELPQATDEWKSQQEAKQYLTPKGEIKSHPKWFYGNEALVDDDYLFYNEQWKLIVDNRLEDEEGYIVNQLPQEEWLQEEKTVNKVYKKYKIVEKTKPTETFETEVSLEYDYNNTKLTATQKWTVRNLITEELTDKETRYFERLRKERNQRLADTDYIISKAFEQGLVLTEEFKDYRQELRDLPQNVTIREVNFETVYPTLPTDFYVV
jgi:hypothetical protein